MKQFADLSIQKKVIAITVIASAFSLLLACAGFVAHELRSDFGRASSEMVTIGRLLAETAAAPLAFRDARAAGEALAALRAEPSVAAGTLYSPDGRVLATYHRGAAEPIPLPRDTEQVYRDRDHIVLFCPVIYEGDRVGTIYLQAHWTGIWARVSQYAFIAASLLGVALVGAFLVSVRLERLITGPILHLAETAAQVSEGQNYSIRANRSGTDELGKLVDRFNEMLAAIHARDEALQEAAETLELRVQERTRELEAEVLERKRTEKDLEAARDAAEESNRAKSRFLANMSHELRTPLNAVIGYSEMLIEGAEADQRTQDVSDLGRIHGAALHLLSLINDVLDISKIEAGKMVLHCDTVEIGPFAREVINTVEPLARRRSNTLILDQEGLQGTMFADGVRFRQSILNLLSNACKFTEKGTVKVAVERRVDKEQPWIVWHVSDTGIGIAPEDMSRLFQAFSQLDSSATRKHGGTGLGLAISQRFCQMMGGHIAVESMVGAGSTFSIWLPDKEEQQG